MVTQLLSLAGTPQADAADALAIALCHAHLSGVQKQLGNSALAMRSGRLRRR